MTALIFLLAVTQIPAPPGQRYDIGGGVKLHLNCTGTGRPTVLLEAGYPGSSLDWTLVQPEAAKFTRVCSYDRAGFGWSDLAKTTRNGVQIANDLHQLLAVAQIKGPYILVGHSFGGPYVRIFAGQYPDEVKGLVLVDEWPSKPSPGPQADMTHPQAATIEQLKATANWKATEHAEYTAMPETIAAIPKSLPDVPVVRVNASEIPGAHHYIQVSHPAIVVKAIRQMVDKLAAP